MLALSLLFHPPAHGCGGFACNSNPTLKDQPPEILQAAERVVFGIERDGTVEMHVQVAYEGPADEFGWIVPVPDEPEIFLTTSALFPPLARGTQPLWDLGFAVEGQCRRPIQPPSLGCAEAGFQSAGVPTPSGEVTGDVGVDILSEETVGPYQTVVLRALSSATLSDWLSDSGFDIPAGFDQVVEPYVAADAAFVALKLRKGFDAGDLAPLGLRWPGEAAMIPIGLTQIAAVPDMPLEVYVLGDHRAVPESYLHVQVNEAAIDWQANGSNYADVVRRAVDEAGGRAFVTDFVGSPALWRDTFDVSAFDGERLRTAEGPISWTRTVTSMLPVFPTELATVVEAHVPLAPGVSAADWLDDPRPRLLDTPDPAFDAEAATLDVEVFVVEPLERAGDLLGRHPVLTRLGSALSPHEMTVDPTFTLNPDLPVDVPTRRRATLTTVCNRNVSGANAPRRLDLPDGREIWLPEGTSLPNVSDGAHGQDAALVIERTGPEGPPEPLVDHRDRLQQLAVDSEQLARVCGGCSSDGPGPWHLALLAMAGLAWRRRRIAAEP